MKYRHLASVLAVQAALFASGPGGGGTGGGGTGGTGGGGATGGVTSPTSAEVRTLSEIQPAGGAVQVKFLLTEPRPITTSGTKLTSSSLVLRGVSLFSPQGDVAGVAVLDPDGSIYVSAVDPSGTFGTNIDYPFLTVTLGIPATTANGSIFPLALGTGSFIDSPTGQLTLSDPKPGTLTIGGSVSITGVFPGGGTWPAGTVIRVMGTGFQPLTQIQATQIKYTARLISANEIDLTLTQPATMDSQPIQIKNPDGSSDKFFSYLRTTAVFSSSHALLRAADPVFQQMTHASAALTLTTGPAPGQFFAVALQNPAAVTAVVTVESSDASGHSVSAVYQLPAFSKLCGDIAEIVPGAFVSAGSRVSITASSPIQMLGLNGDENGWTMTPVLPAF